MADIFVSYKAEDRARLKPLVAALEAEGFDVWWDAHIGGGTNWRDEIQQHLDLAKCVIVAWSTRSVGPEGRFVRDEASVAQLAGSYLPIKIDAVKPPLGFGEVQAIDFVGWKSKRAAPCFVALVDAVNAHLTGEAPVVRPTAIEQPKASRRTVMAGGVAVLATAGAGGWLFLRPGSAISDSIAVLPFANLSGDPSRSYFSDGIAEEIRSALVRLRGITVIGRTSSEAVRNEDAKTAAKKLGVGRILAGSVRQSPSTIRITAELIEGSTGEEQWSQSYDRAPGDVIKIQTDIAENVAHALSAALGTVARAAFALGGTQNVEAQNLVLQAQPLVIKDTKNTLEQARRLLDEATRLDASYADAYARNAILIARLEGIYATSSAQMTKGLQEARLLASRATTLAPNFATGHHALSQVYSVALQFPRALTEGKRALDLAPNDANVLRGYSNLLSLVGDSAQAIAMSNRAREIDPLNSESYSNQVRILYAARRYSEAVAISERIRRDAPDLFVWPILFADCLVGAGKLDAAKSMYASSEQDHPFRLAGEAVLATKQGDRATALARLARTRQLYQDAENYQYAQIDAQLGNHDAAFLDLERAWVVKDPGLQYLRVDPSLDPLRTDPRFASLLQKLQFPA